MSYRAAVISIIVVVVLVVIGCIIAIASGFDDTDADVASRNLATAAEQFELPRHIVGINGITDKYLFEVVGYCSLETTESPLGETLETTCKVVDENGDVGFKKAFLGLSDNVTWVMTQLEPAQVSTTRYRVIWKPEVLIPNIDRP